MQFVLLQGGRGRQTEGIKISYFVQNNLIFCETIFKNQISQISRQRIVFSTKKKVRIKTYNYHRFKFWLSLVVRQNAWPVWCGQNFITMLAACCCCCCCCWSLPSSRWYLQNFRPPPRSCLAEFPLGKWRWVSRCIPRTHCKSPYCGPRISFNQETHISSKLETQGQKVYQKYTRFKAHCKIGSGIFLQSVKWFFDHFKRGERGSVSLIVSELRSC